MIYASNMWYPNVVNENILFNTSTSIILYFRLQIHLSYIWFLLNEIIIIYILLFYIQNKIIRNLKQDVFIDLYVKKSIKFF